MMYTVNKWQTLGIIHKLNMNFSVPWFNDFNRFSTLSKLKFCGLNTWPQNQVWKMNNPKFLPIKSRTPHPPTVILSVETVMHIEQSLTCFPVLTLSQYQMELSISHPLIRPYLAHQSVCWWWETKKKKSFRGFFSSWQGLTWDVMAWVWPRVKTGVQIISERAGVRHRWPHSDWEHTYTHINTQGLLSLS